MKRNFFLGLLLSMFTILSCEKGQWDVASSNENDVERTNIISLEEAREELENILKDLNEQSGGASEFSGKVIEEAFTLGRGNVLTRAGNTDSSMMYVFNFADEGGFAIMSGHTDLPPLLALSYSGTFTDESADENPGLGIFLLGLDTMVGDINTDNPGDKISGDDESNPITKRVIEYEEIVYKPGGYCSVTWGQKAPYYNLCPPCDTVEHAVTGCVTTAVAQLMSIYKYPDSYGEYYFNWDRMTAQPSGAEVPLSAQEQIAELMVALGEKQNLDTDYGASLSNANQENIPRTFENFGYSSGGSLNAYNIETIVSELDKGYCVLVTGDAIKEKYRGTGKTTYSEGHCWLCHGLLEQRKTTKLYVNGKLDSSNTKSEWYLLCNWGWEGYQDGYFLSEAFNANENPSYPTNEGVKCATRGESGNYQYNLTAVTGIRL